MLGLNGLMSDSQPYLEMIPSAQQRRVQEGPRGSKRVQDKEHISLDKHNSNLHFGAYYWRCVYTKLSAIVVLFVGASGTRIRPQ